MLYNVTWIQDFFCHRLWSGLLPEPPLSGLRSFIEPLIVMTRKGNLVPVIVSLGETAWLRVNYTEQLCAPPRSTNAIGTISQGHCGLVRELETGNRDLGRSPQISHKMYLRRKQEKLWLDRYSLSNIDKGNTLQLVCIVSMY